MEATLADSSTNIMTAGNTTNSSTTDANTTLTTTIAAGEQGWYVPMFLKLDYGSDFRESKKTASGASGVVYVGEILSEEFHLDVKKVAIKKLSATNLTQSQLDAFYQEISIMYHFKDNPLIAKMVAYSENPYCIVIKYYSKGNLEKYLKSDSVERSKKVVLPLLADISQGIYALHSRGFRHSDLKTTNVLIEKDKRKKRVVAVLTDFGISKVLAPDSLSVQAFKVSNIAGFSLPYASPELFRQRKDKMPRASTDHIYATDVYAYAIIVYVVVTGKQPWTKRK